jgi:hypothetical protein
MGDTFIISGLREKRSAIAGALIEKKRELDRLQADLFHVDAVLKLYGEEPADIPTKGRMPKRSTYFGRNEISRRCYDLLREKGTASATDVAARAMREKGLDPEADRKLRVDFTKRILVTFHDLVRNGTVRKIGVGKGVRWELVTTD